MESVKKVPEGIKGDPTRPLGEKPTKSKENLPEAPLGPRHAAYALKTATKTDYWQGKEDETGTAKRRG